MDLVLLYLQQKPNKTTVHYDKYGHMECDRCNGHMKYNKNGVAQCTKCNSIGVYR